MNGGKQRQELAPKPEVCETGCASHQQSLHGSPEIKVPSPQHTEMKKNKLLSSHKPGWQTDITTDNTVVDGGGGVSPLSPPSCEGSGAHSSLPPHIVRTKLSPLVSPDLLLTCAVCLAEVVCFGVKSLAQVTTTSHPTHLTVTDGDVFYLYFFLPVVFPEGLVKEASPVWRR